jgi:hypothetical protein
MSRQQVRQQAEEQRGKPEVARHTQRLLQGREQQDGMTVCVVCVYEDLYLHSPPLFTYIHYLYMSFSSSSFFFLRMSLLAVWCSIAQ